MKLSYRLVMLSTTVEGRLKVSITKIAQTRVYHPKKTSAARLNNFLADRVPCTVFIDTFGPTVFYEV